MEENCEALRRLIDTLDFGSSTAEKDTLLETARIETSVFTDIVADRVDLIRGTKGSGKTALFRIFTKHLTQHVYDTERIVIINGVEEPAGDPIFQAFKPRFEELQELDLHNFWRVYLVALINRHVFNAQQLQKVLRPVRKDIDQFQQICREHNFPFEKKAKGLVYIVDWALSAARQLRYGATVTSDGTIKVSVEPTSQKSARLGDVPQDTPIFINEIRTKLLDILQKVDLRVWVMIDRLDEVFPRRSDLETKALRSLLLTTNSFPDHRLRLKLFLRDDIFRSLIDPESGFTALTHVTDRASDILNWDPDLICKLIVKRIYCYEIFRKHFDVNAERLDNDKEYQLECFHHIFPQRAGRSMKTLDWIYSYCQDGQGVVTPRDIIDLLQYARSEQMNIFNKAPQKVKDVMSFEALKYGYQKMSERRVTTYLQAEFPHLWNRYISRLENQKSTFTREALNRILETDDNRIAKTLVDVGVLSFVPKKAVYTVPHLYRWGMKMIQGTDI